MSRCALVLALAALLAACGGSSSSGDSGAPPGGPQPPVNPPASTLDTDLRNGLQNAAVIALSPIPAQDAAQVDLGRALFFDKILSGNRDVSCATCHLPASVLGDGMSLSIGTAGTGAAPTRTLGAGRQFVPRNSPTLLNIAFLAAGPSPMMFWDARVRRSRTGVMTTPAGGMLPASVTDVLAAQAMMPVTSRTEMRGELTDVPGGNELAAFGDGDFTGIWQAIMLRLLAIPEYQAKFAAAFPGVAQGALGFEHAAAAIAAFQRQAFNRTDSPFDQYLAGDNSALTDEQKRGGVLFFGDARCWQCHIGPLLGGTNFANIGAPQLGPGVGTAAPLDAGFNQFAFRVQPLRNIELTAPYMHDGAYATLEVSVRHYNDAVTAQQTFDASQLAPTLQGSVHNDTASVNAVSANLDPRMPPVGSITPDRVTDLVTFLKALTDPAARDLSSLVPASVPSGLPVAD